MLDLVQVLTAIKNRWELVTVIVLAGIALIAVNVVSHALVENYKVRKQRRELVKRNLKPLLSATTELISRISELLIQEKKELIDAIRSYSPEILAQRIPTLSAATMNRHESTAYRLVNFLTLAAYFGRQTADVPSFRLLDRVEYFIQNKIAVGLRGNLYGKNFLSTELQEELAESYLACNPHLRAAELSIGTFVANLKTRKYDPVLFACALSFFDVDPARARVADGISRTSDEWRHILVLAHLAIYLIDFYQELAEDPQWEEHRLYFVRLVRQWNADVPKRRYLYEPGDLDGDNYLDTFPARRTSAQSSLGLGSLVPSLVGCRDLCTRWHKFVALNYRGSRFGKRHHPKAIRSWGVKIKLKDHPHYIKWNDDLETVYESVRSYMRVRFLEM
ncbi:MAG TPA: hypothetical protein VNN77_20045 [candidate division Zixibacteria bacterium]|nr:hypothetical protein [candidate division Zixibacteria bacterium]